MAEPVHACLEQAAFFVMWIILNNLDMNNLDMERGVPREEHDHQDTFVPFDWWSTEQVVGGKKKKNKNISFMCIF